MSTSRTPDPIIRLVSHAVVGGVVAFAIHKTLPRATVAAQLIGMVLAAVVHEELDAPVASWIAANTNL